MKSLFLLLLLFFKLSALELTISSYIDDTDNLDITQISKKEFTPKNDSSFAYGKVKGSLWFKLEIKNSSNENNFILSINESFYQKANLYYYEANKWNVEKNGLNTPLDKRDVKSNIISFKISIPENKTQIYYLNLGGLYNYFGNIELYTEADFFKASKFGVDTFYFFSFGLFFIVSLFNFLIFLKLKESIYLYYFAYVVSYIFYLTCISGLSLYAGIEITHLVMFATALAVIFMINFSREYLHAKMYTPKFDFVLKLLVLMIFIAGVISLFVFQPWNKIISYLNIIAFAILIINALVIFIKGYTESFLYLVVSVIYFVAIIIFFLMLINILPYNEFTRYGYIFAAVFEISSFSIMLANRYNKMKSETIRTQSELINIKNKTEQMLQSVVTEKTSELIKTNIKLKNLLDERELLLREIFHRVKNNFQVVIALLWFKKKNSKEEEKIHMELINHIKSMSTIHELLYNAKNITSVNSKEYIEKIVSPMRIQYENNKNIINSDIDSFEISFNDAMALGIIINEVITNSIKHYSKELPCVINITFSKQENLYNLKIKDNGNGFKVQPKNSDGLGLKLIKQFVGKLKNGLFQYENANGTIFELTFSL